MPNAYFPAGEENVDNIQEYSEEVYELARVFGMSLEEADRELQEHWEEWHKEDYE